MKKLLLTIILSVFALSGCSMVYSTPQYGEPYEADFAYLDRYELVNWNAAEYGAIQYSYYDYDRVFIVIYGNRVYIIPYEYFYRYIMPHFRGRIIWRSYDYLANYWGYHYYNNLWNYWYYRHHRPHWRPHRDWYFHHKRTSRNGRFIVKKDELSQKFGEKQRYTPDNRPEIRKKYENSPKNQRIYTPRGQNTPQVRRQGAQGAVKSPSRTPNRTSGASRARKRG